MAKFKTRDGREWIINITLGHLKELRRDCGIDMRDALKKGTEGQNNSIADAMGDPDKFGQMIWTLCGEQVSKAGLTPEQFVDQFDGDSFRDAVAAVWDAIFSFYQGLNSGAKAGQAMRKGMIAIDGKLGEEIESRMSRLTSRIGAGNLEDVLGSTPGLTPSEN